MTKLKSLTCSTCGRKGKPEGFTYLYQNKTKILLATCKNIDACRRRAA